jgi:hypothetical protein
MGCWAGFVVKDGETRNAYRTLVRDLLENVHLENREEDERITLRWILGKQVVRMEDWWNWLRIVFINGLLYWNCGTLGFSYQRQACIIRHCTTFTVQTSYSKWRWCYFQLKNYPDILFVFLKTEVLSLPDP